MIVLVALRPAPGRVALVQDQRADATAQGTQGYEAAAVCCLHGGTMHGTRYQQVHTLRHIPWRQLLSGHIAQRRGVAGGGGGGVRAARSVDAVVGVRPLGTRRHRRC